DVCSSDLKRKALADVFEAAGPDLDFSKPEVLNALGAKDSAEAAEKVCERNREIEALYDECKKLAEIEEIANRVAGEVDLPVGRRMVHPEAQAPKTLGEMIVNSSGFQLYWQARDSYAG